MSIKEFVCTVVLEILFIIIEATEIVSRHLPDERLDLGLLHQSVRQ